MGALYLHIDLNDPSQIVQCDREPTDEELQRVVSGELAIISLDADDDANVKYMEATGYKENGMPVFCEIDWHDDSVFDPDYWVCLKCHTVLPKTEYCRPCMTTPAYDWRAARKWEVRRVQQKNEQKAAK